MTAPTRPDPAVRPEATAGFRDLFDANPNPMWIFDLESLAFLAVNDAAVARYGWSREEFLAMTIKDIRPGEDHARLLANVAAVTNGLDDAGLWRHRRRDGSIIDVEITSHTIDWAGRRAEVVLALDVTQRLRAEEALRQLNAELEQRVSERTAALENALRELESFSYSVAHDLRAPLRAIHGFAQILEADHATGLDGEGRRLLGVVRERAEHMGVLIEELLEFSRIGRVPLRAEAVDMGQLVRESIEALGERPEGRTARVAVGVLPPARGDAGLLRQVWQNLLDNAVKYTRRRDDALVEVFAEDGEYVVRDNGVGFDMAHAARLFQPFQRLHTADEFEGTGVGLANVRRILERHGGSIRAEGHPGRGATFRFRLPAAS